jgi:hypothetical protein
MLVSPHGLALPTTSDNGSKRVDDYRQLFVWVGAVRCAVYAAARQPQDKPQQSQQDARSALRELDAAAH